MPKLILLVLSVFTIQYVFSQNNNLPDTAIRQDSIALEEIKDDVLDNLPVITIDDNEFGDVSTQNVSSLLTAGRDPFYAAASFNFSPVRFRIRGYEGDLFATYINGIPMDNLDNGFTPYGLWGGLNNVMRNRDVSLGLRYNTFAFGDIGNSTNIDTRASKQRKQTSFSYAYSNRSYTHRLMFTHSTGINRQGWAFTFSGSRRYADEGYVPGTYYNSWSYFAGVDKRLGQKHLLSIVAFGAPTENGRQGAATKEMIDLAGTHYYNPYWGYQNGKKRNASVGNTNQPVFIFTHDFRISSKASLITAIGYSFGKRSVSGIDWYNAPDPRPDYYRYLPSYQDDPFQKQQVEQLLRNNEAERQIDWQHFYDVNRVRYETVLNANGIQGNNVSGLRSHYVLQERVTDAQRISFNTVLNIRLSRNAMLTGGIAYQHVKNTYYARLADLLGGEFYVNLNQFAERDFPNDPYANQNDLDNPNRILHIGDKYGYDYDITINKFSEWLQAVFQFSKFDFFAAGELSYTEFWRTGNVRNGLFPNNSFGKSTVNKFPNYSAKAGITYKINGRNYLYVNAASLTKAPYFENAYISPRTRDFLQDSLRSEKIRTAEAGYVMNAPKLKIRLGGYYTSFKYCFNVLTFYTDQFNTFGNCAVSNINKIQFGGEFGLEAAFATNLSFNAAAAVGRYYYNSRQQVVVTVDNSTQLLMKEPVYSNNFRVPSTPQEAYSAGISYRSPQFWFISLTGNYFNEMWLDFNPIRRTYSAVETLDPKSELWRSIIEQEKLPAAYTLDLFAGYSMKLMKIAPSNRYVYLVLNAGINNLLNNKDIITGGYEQLRFDFDTHDVNTFPSKYYYSYGLNYFLSAAIRF